MAEATDACVDVEGRGVNPNYRVLRPVTTGKTCSAAESPRSTTAADPRSTPRRQGREAGRGMGWLGALTYTAVRQGLRYTCRSPTAVGDEPTGAGGQLTAVDVRPWSITGRSMLSQSHSNHRPPPILPLPSAPPSPKPTSKTVQYCAVTGRGMVDVKDRVPGNAAAQMRAHGHMRVGLMRLR